MRHRGELQRLVRRAARFTIHDEIGVGWVHDELDLAELRLERDGDGLAARRAHRDLTGHGVVARA